MFSVYDKTNKWFCHLLTLSKTETCLSLVEEDPFNENEFTSAVLYRVFIWVFPIMSPHLGLMVSRYPKYLNELTHSI